MLIPPYIAQLVRYGTDANPGEEIGDYLFAFPLSAHAGNGRPTFLPLSRQFGESNWVEVINTSSESVEITVDFYNGDGSTSSNVRTLAPYSQHHYFIDEELLSSGDRGYVRVTPSTANSVISQSMFYFRGETGSIQAMEGILARESLGASYIGSYNLFLGMENWLTLSNVTDSEVSVLVQSASSGGSGSTTLTIGANQTTEISVGAEAGLNTVADSYGVLSVTPDRAGSLIIDLHRKRDFAGETDFAFPTEIRAQ